ncbi:MAG: endolytic transglycosylase MltG [Patescibacteria group bacterium]
MFFIATLFIATVWWFLSTSPFGFSDSTSFTINRGDGVREIANNLYNKGLIKNRVAFFITIKLLNLDTKIQAGEYSLNKNMSAAEIAKTLTHGVADIKITIPEGWSLEEIVDYLQNTLHIKTNNYLTEIKQWKQQEGYFFPDTYLIPQESSISAILALTRENFDKKVKKITREQLIMASLVEREAKTEEDRKIIAGILLKRLRENMPLEVDATVQYAVANCRNPVPVPDGFILKNKCDWWPKNITEQDLKIDSLYNTRKYAGLPPGPICNPGISAINAVLAPQETDYYFYLTGEDGKMRYGKTLAEHNNNIVKYLK